MAKPKLSIILATDTYETIAPVIERLRRQTAHSQVEIVLVAPSAGAVEAATAYREEFAGIRVVEDPLEDLGPARAAGVQAASAEWVFIGETHSYPRPEMAERLIRHASGSWSVLTPAIGNANPVTVWSWAAMLSDYGCWGEGRAAGKTPQFPAHNIAGRREALQALGDGLPSALALGGDLPSAMQATGHKAWFEPAAVIDHLNLPSPRHWAKERFATGVVVASHRLRGWSVARRLLYLVASPLIPFVLGWRVMPAAWRTVRARQLPLSTLFWVGVGLTVRTGGELIAYAGVPGGRWRRQMYDYEVHKAVFAGQPAVRSGTAREQLAEATG